MIDSDYRGNIGIILTNFTACDVDIKIGDRIAQIIILKTAKDLLKNFLSLLINC